ncbi:DEAD/DEAH box helicase [Corynebacterium pyruviciproducens]
MRSELATAVRYGFVSAHPASASPLNPMLVENDSHPMLEVLRGELETCASFHFSVAFVNTSGIAALKQALVEAGRRACEAGTTNTIVTSCYLDFNEPEALRELLRIRGVDVYVHDDEQRGHPKGYVFEHAEGVTTAIVGSSNLTNAALAKNEEWNFKFSTTGDGDVADQLRRAVDKQSNRCVRLTEEWIARYERRRRRPIVFDGNQPRAGEKILPNAMQEVALEDIAECRESGERRAVVISATGTGKTILAALAVRQENPARFLFVAHREQILVKARAEFERVLGVKKYGMAVGGKSEWEADYLFASVQTLSRNLHRLARGRFDYIVIDEVHKSGAATYKQIIDHFQPQFLLGLTATPERTDGFNIFELFDYNVPYEIRLGEALDQNMLVPFHYYGIADTGRVDDVVRVLHQYGRVEDVHGLVFSSTVKEARTLAGELTARGIPAVPLSGSDSIETREKTVAWLEAGEIDYIVTVDIFNEGIDIPCVNQIVLMRETQSPFVFTQQLGRGLRKAKGKDHLRVIDFIGNYRNNYMIPMALMGDQSRSKESLRRKVLTGEGVPAGSSVSFDRISTRRILDAISTSTIDGMREIRAAFTDLRHRLGTIPRLMDFLRFDTIDPDVVVRRKNYWRLLFSSFGAVDTAPTEAEDHFLTFLSRELLDSIRPQEFEVLQALLARASEGGGIDPSALLHSPLARRSVFRVLTLAFYSAKQQGASFGTTPLIVERDDRWFLFEEFRGLYLASGEEANPATSFRAHVDDIVATGLALARLRGTDTGDLVVGRQYTRRQVCRMLGWDSNQEGVINGYKVDQATATCPIFVTYDATDYNDHFVDNDVLHWYSRLNRTLKSKEIASVLDPAVTRHLFVKKSDQEGQKFYYLGEVDPCSARDAEHGGKNVVTVDLVLHSPVEESLFKHLSS